MALVYTPGEVLLAALASPPPPLMWPSFLPLNKGNPKRAAQRAQRKARKITRRKAR
ncbi:hypothetical protein KTR66_04505 [Roseococcus sp. SDR]|uniref:hypothetical protein n=1 Tax=Roseococcus sp. SDR TaxID=2835532 RepID=UPI001BCDF46A|nr:hypothetical protein [Roseococcus sp. SDR]MBS7789240.1 hypothetical protein [Roseococcus sp. SDR]MBV1844554.1 hypothetical protein [Roseococcus sp. SDR]